LKSAIGAHLLASGSISEGDFSLVLLQDAPAGTTFAGWDILPNLGAIPTCLRRRLTTRWRFSAIGTLYE